MGKELGEKRARSEEEVEEKEEEEVFVVGRAPQKPAKTKGDPEDEPLRNLIVKQLPMSFDEFDLKLLFEPFGLMERWKLIQYPTGGSKGYGFVKYVEVASANDAMEGLHGSVAEANSTGEKKIITVDYAAKNDALELLRKQGGGKTDPDEGGPEVLRNLMVTHLDKKMTEVELRAAFVHIGKLESVRLMQEGKLCTSKGFGFVKFKNMSDAEKAISELDQTLPGEGKKKVKIGYAKYHEAMDAMRWVNLEKKNQKNKDKEQRKKEEEGEGEE